MHAVVMESLEEFLAGTLEPREQRLIEAHLGDCGACREELQGMEDLNLLFGSLRAETSEIPEDFGLEPAPAFYAGVMQRVEENRASPAWSNLFALDPFWGRRLAVSCLLALVAVSALLISNERAYSSGPMPDAVMAEQNAPAFDSAPASESMLVTLANYEH